MTTRPTTLPGQIPPQNAPLSYLDANGQQITDINWYLFLYRLWKEVVSSTGANALLLAQDALLMDPVSGGGGGGTGLTPIPDKTILANYTGVVATPTPFALNTIAAAINATNNWAKPQNVASATLIDGATVTPNGDLSNNFYLLTTATVGASRAMAVPTGTIPTGAIINIEVEQPATGGPCAIVWAAGWKWGRGGQDPQSVGSAVASSVDSYSFQKQSNGNYHGVMIGQAGPTGAGYKATSLTSLVTGLGSRVFVTQAGLAYTAGARVRATSPSSGDYMEGIVATYAFSTLTVTMDLNSGTGTRTDWNINISGVAGVAATIAVGAVSSGTAAVTNSGTSNAAVFNFVVPAGPPGASNSAGPSGTAGRLTLTSGVPVTTTDVIGATTIYWEPYKGNQMQLWDGANWTTYAYSSTSLAIGTKTAGLPYDIFARQVAGIVTLDDLAWTSGAARATAVTYQDGRLCKSGDKTRLYLGSYYTTSTTTTEDSGGGTVTQVGGKRFLWNNYNQIPRFANVIDTTATWNYTTAAYRQSNGATGNKVEFINGDGALFDGRVIGALSNTQAVSGTSGIGVNSTTVNSAQLGGVSASSTAGVVSQAISVWNGYLAPGYQAINWLEKSQAAGTMSWYGNIGSVFQTGLQIQTLA